MICHICMLGCFGVSNLGNWGQFFGQNFRASFEALFPRFIVTVFSQLEYGQLTWYFFSLLVICRLSCHVLSVVFSGVVRLYCTCVHLASRSIWCHVWRLSVLGPLGPNTRVSIGLISIRRGRRRLDIVPTSTSVWKVTTKHVNAMLPFLISEWNQKHLTDVSSSVWYHIAWNYLVFGQKMMQIHQLLKKTTRWIFMKYSLYVNRVWHASFCKIWSQSDLWSRRSLRTDRHTYIQRT